MPKRKITKDDIRFLDNISKHIIFKKSDVTNQIAFEQIKTLSRFIESGDREIQAQIILNRIKILNDYAGEYAEKDEVKLFDLTVVEEDLLLQLIEDVLDEDEE